ncbi:MAG: MASE3 domain-containing protein [Thermodesulfobacteriota bacterium]|nr:MASE3 domain-containing protein [Thermodesulfobacteriota bacterium]
MNGGIKPAPYRSLPDFTLIITALVFITFTSFHSFLLFHIIAEFFSIIVAGCIFVLAWNGRRLIDNRFLLIVGIAFGFVGVLDFLHTLSYEGMDIIAGYDANLPTQLWISARYMEALTLLLALFWLNRKITAEQVLIVYGLITILLLFAILFWGIFPDCFVEGRGLTPFKKISEYIICLILLVAFYLINRHRDAFDPVIRRYLLIAIACTIVSEMVFTLYMTVYGMFNIIGHLLKIFAFYLFYKAMIQNAFVRPNTLLFTQLDKHRKDLEKSTDILAQQTQKQSLALEMTTATLTSEMAEKKQKEQLYRRVGDLIPYGLWICDPRGEIIYLSETLLDMLGMTLAECREQGLRSRMAPADAKEMATSWKQCMETGDTWDHELRFIDKNNEERLVISRGIPFYDDKGELLYWGGINLDVTDRVAMKTMLDKERKRFYFVLENLPAFVCLKSPGHALHYANRYFRERFGEPGNQKCYQVMYRRQKPCDPCDLIGVLDDHVPVEKDWLDAPDNRMYRVYSYPFVDMDGTAMVLQMGVDITKQMAAEEQMVRYSQQLERSNRDLRDFAYVASHDLQEPLRKITTFANRVRVKYEDQLDEKGRDYLARMENAATRMRTMIKALLEYSRISTRQKPFVATNLEQLLYDVIDDIDDQVRRTNAIIHVDRLDTIEADPVQMRQLFQNLISNSLKFCGKQSPEVSIEGKLLGYHKGAVNSVFGDTPPHWYQVLVKDNGIGFDESYLNRIFAPFQRLHNRHDYPGTGIGLSICQKVVDRHGGTITARSQPGMGSTFIVTLPLKQSGKHQYDKSGSAGNDRFNGGRRSG